MKLNAKQLRSYSPLAISGSQPKANSQKPIANSEIYIILDNVLDTYNVGSIFRLADAVAAKKIYLCGGTEIPPNPRIKKASINTTDWVEWEYCESAVEAIKKVRSLWNCHSEESSTKDLKIKNKSGDSSLITRNDRGLVIAIEQSKKSVPYDQFEYKLPICLVVGHESCLESILALMLWCLWG
ncbi:hypothetical protein HYU95_02605 [Candidatus Daviesbacteria bacterium]|nr:hypothetical protein [Candidatus Daviesbacteria bacterium]